MVVKVVLLVIDSHGTETKKFVILTLVAQYVNNSSKLLPFWEQLFTHLAEFFEREWPERIAMS